MKGFSIPKYSIPPLCLINHGHLTLGLLGGGGGGDDKRNPQRVKWKEI